MSISSFRAFFLIGVAVFLTTGLFSLAVSQVKLTPAGLVITQGGVGAVQITLAGSASKLDLKPGPFKDKISGATLTTPKLTFALATGGDLSGQTLNNSDPLEVQAKITDFTASTDAEVGVFNGSTFLGDLEIVALDVPLNISIDGDGASADKPLAFVDGEESYILLKNADAIAYPVDWCLQEDQSSDCDKTTLAPHGSARIRVKPDHKLFSLPEWVHPSALKGLLELHLSGPDKVKKELLPVQRMAVNLSLMRHDSSTTTIWSYVYAGGLLVIGGLLSILASSVLPSMLRKVALRGQINDLANRTSSVSTRVDSYLRVLLRLERKNTGELLKTVQWYSFTSVDTLDQVSASIDRLTKRLEVAERLDELRRKFEAASETAPPSVIDDADKQLQLAANQLHSFALPDDDVTAATAFLDKAKASLAMMDSPDALAKSIADKFKSLKLRKVTVDAATIDYADLKGTLPGPFKILDQPFDDPSKITYEMAFGIDHSIATIQTIFDYAMVRTSLPSGTASKNCATPIGNAAALQHECELIALLSTMSWQALREARSLVREMREGIYENQVLEEIGRKGQAEVVFDTQRARVNLPIYLYVAFKDPRFATAAAVDRLTCKWDFPDDLHEQTWRVCHFFTGKEADFVGNKAPITVTIDSQRKASLLPPSPAPIEKPRGEKEAGGKIASLSDTTSKPAADASLAPPADIANKGNPQGSEGDGLAATTPGSTGTSGNALPPETKNVAIVPLPITRTTIGPKTLTSIIQIQPDKSPSEYSRAIASFLRFLIAFGVALAGLLAGALAQLEKLDFLPASLAIVALGFGADSVKNLLTQPAPKADTKSA
jgi:hypothetical protein